MEFEDTIIKQSLEETMLGKWLSDAGDMDCLNKKTKDIEFEVRQALSIAIQSTRNSQPPKETQSTPVRKGYTFDCVGRTHSVPDTKVENNNEEGVINIHAAVKHMVRLKGYMQYVREHYPDVYKEYCIFEKRRDKGLEDICNNLKRVTR